MNPELEAKLSALLDGELSPEEAALLRAEIARSPELAARFAALAAVDDELRTLPGRSVPSDLRARMVRRIASERAAPSLARSPSRVPPRRSGRWLAAAALAAAAAALALLALPRAQREPSQVAQLEPAPAPQQVAPAPPDAAVAPAPPPAPAPVVQIVEQPPPPAPTPEPLGVEELAETEDLPVIEVLDVLAELDELEEVGSG